MKETKGLRQQTNNTRIKLSLEEIDVLDPDLLGRIFEALSKNACKA